MSPQTRARILLATWVATLVVLASAPAGGDILTGAPLGASGYAPRVPVSALARPAAWFDPSRLHIATSVSVGSGFGSGVNALQLTRLSYQFQAPLWMNVSLGNAWGASRGRNSFFLEGIDVAYRPIPSLLFQVQYRELRSPLQVSPGPGYGFWSP